MIEGIAESGEAKLTITGSLIGLITTALRMIAARRTEPVRASSYSGRGCSHVLSVVSFARVKAPSKYPREALCARLDCDKSRPIFVSAMQTAANNMAGRFPGDAKPRCAG